ncbi:hypothetical protein AAG570_008411 [Ranatra chinensis]|uniref:Integrase catalytic domain-containing protein n=1 Tax=Ranatra chinensis TaxID=642074 RepID=A0ABD0YQX3_9HEMI
MIERLHGRLQEHLHILRIWRGMTGEEAWVRALLAYNSSLHEATGYTPLELMRAWQREDSPVSIEYVCGELVDQADRKKRDRVDRLNNKATDRWNRVQAGDYVFIKNWYRRRTTDPRFVGPYIVDTKLSRFRLKVKCVETGHVRVIHANESRPPRGTTTLGPRKVFFCVLFFLFVTLLFLILSPRNVFFFVILYSTCLLIGCFYFDWSGLKGLEGGGGGGYLSGAVYSVYSTFLDYRMNTILTLNNFFCVLGP